MDELQKAIASEKQQRKQKKPMPEAPMPEDKGEGGGMDVEAMKNFMEGDGMLPSQESEPTARFVWDIEDGIQPQEVSFTVDGEEITDPSEIKAWVDSYIVAGQTEETEEPSLEEEE